MKISSCDLPWHIFILLFALYVHYLIYTMFQKKLVHQADIDNFQFSTDFQNSFTGTLCGKFTIKLLLKIPPHPTRVATLPCEIYMNQGKCDHHRGAGTKPVSPATNSSFSTPSSTSWCCADHFLRRSWFEVFKETPAKELTESNC